MKTAVLTISDTRTADDDASGDLLAGLLSEFGAIVISKSIVPDEREQIEAKLVELCKSGEVALVVTTGGTGFSPRDVTPEATKAVIEREAPGISEAIRRGSAKQTPMAMLSRGIAGIRGKTLIINLPGSPRAVDECFEVVKPVLQHAVKLISGDTAHLDEKE